METENI